MIKVDQFSISYRPKEDAGMVHLALANGKGADLPIDSPMEASFLLQMLGHEGTVYYDPENELLVTGMEVTGEGDDD